MDDFLEENILGNLEHIAEEVLGIKDDDEENMEMECPQFSCMETEELLFQLLLLMELLHYKPSKLTKLKTAVN